MSEPLSLRTGARLGRYLLRNRIGQGGMGEVWEALDEDLGRAVAIKTLRTDVDSSDAEFRQRFLREARLLASLSHPNILPIFDFGMLGDAIFFVSPLLPGGTLSEKLRAPVPVSQTLGWLQLTADALDYGHSRNVVHRDVKPANVLFDSEGRLFLSDFGLAKPMNEMASLTRQGLVVGTPHFMAPEQVRGEPVDGRTDQYALGVMAHRLIVGVLPYEGLPTSIILQKLEAKIPPPPVTFHKQGLPDGIVQVFSRVLEMSPSDRFSTCSEFVSELSKEAPRITPGPGLPSAALLLEPRTVVQGPGEDGVQTVPLTPPGLVTGGTILSPPTERTPFIGSLQRPSSPNIPDGPTRVGSRAPGDDLRQLPPGRGRSLLLPSIAGAALITAVSVVLVLRSKVPDTPAGPSAAPSPAHQRPTPTTVALVFPSPIPVAVAPPEPAAQNPAQVPTPTTNTADRELEKMQEAEKYYKAGKLRQGMGDLDGAASDYSRALELNGRLVAAYYGRSGIYSRRANYKGAIEDLSRALEVDPRNVDCLRARATAYRKLGENAGAVRDLERALAVRPNDEKLANMLSDVKSEVSRESSSPDAAGSKSKATSAEPPGEPEVAGKFGAIGRLKNLGKFITVSGKSSAEDAKSALKAACAASGGCSSSYWFRGKCGAFAVGPHAHYGHGKTREAASQAALRKCQEDGGKDCRLVDTICNE